MVGYTFLVYFSDGYHRTDCRLVVVVDTRFYEGLLRSRTDSSVGVESSEGRLRGLWHLVSDQLGQTEERGVLSTRFIIKYGDLHSIKKFLN